MDAAFRNSSQLSGLSGKGDIEELFSWVDP